MKKVKIINYDGFFGKSYEDDFKKFGLKIGDVIEVYSFVNNAVYYQPIPKGSVFFIYTWNIEEI